MKEDVSLCFCQDAALMLFLLLLSLTFSWRAGMQGKDALHQYVKQIIHTYLVEVSNPHNCSRGTLRSPLSYRE